MLTINGHPALDFASAGMLSSTSFPLNTEVTVFVVAKTANDPASWGTFAHHGGRNNDWGFEYRSTSDTVVQWQSSNDNSGAGITLVQERAYLLVGKIEAGRFCRPVCLSCLPCDVTPDRVCTAPCLSNVAPLGSSG